MNNDRHRYSPRRGRSLYPTPAPSPEVDGEGDLLPPGTPRYNPIQLPQRNYFTSQPHLHPLLSYANHPGISYDVREGPSFASVHHARLEWAHESATNPPSPQITIICQVLPGPFIVHPSGQDYDFVTVHDILHAVHCAFNKVIHSAEDCFSLRSRKSGRNEPTATTLLLGEHPCEELSALSERYTWKGLSEEISPGNWLLHIE